jgi:uncharacterized membrane protein required for colicin V production
MDLFGAIGRTPLADVGIFLGLFAMFILGFMQGPIRRLLGILALVFAFLLAANLRDPFGDWLGGYWTQFSRQYVHQIAFLVLFGVGSAVLTVLIQGFYKRTEILSDHPAVEELLGGAFGMLEGVVVIALVVVILDSTPDTGHYGAEVAQLRQVQDLVDGSSLCAFVRDVLVPPFVHIFGIALPPDLLTRFG